MKAHLISPVFRTSYYLLSEDGFTANTNIMPPLGIAFLTAYLRKNGFNVKQDDLNINVIYDNMFGKKSEKININRLNVRSGDLERYLSGLPGKFNEYLEHVTDLLFKKIDIKKPDMVGIPIGLSYQLNCALLIARKIKNELGAKVVFGGKQIPSYFAREMLEKFDFIDFFVSGAGELPLLRLCETLERGGNLEHVPNLLYREGGKLKLSKSNEKFDFKNTPPPDFDGLPIHKYKKTCIGENLILPYQATRGCIYNCSFCSYRLQESFDFKSPEKVSSEIQMIRDKYKTRFFLFLDNLININKKYLEDFCNEIKKLDILWSDSFKPMNLSRDVFIKMRDSGCIILTHGLESPSPKILRYVNKQFTPKDVEKVLESSHRAGIWNLVNLIIGFPHETESDINSIFKFMKKNRNFINSVRIYEFYLTSKSEMFDNPEKFKIRHHNRKQAITAPYDEIGGLKWEDKKSQNLIFINKVIKFLKNNNMDVGFVDPRNPNFYQRIDLVYNLYDKFHDKNEVFRNLKDSNVFQVNQLQ